MLWHVLLRNQRSQCHENQTRGNLYTVTIYRIRSLNSKSVGSSGRQPLLFFFFFFLFDKCLAPCQNIYDYRQENQTFSFEPFLCIWVGCWLLLLFPLLFFYPFPYFFPTFFTVVSISFFSPVLVIPSPVHRASQYGWVNKGKDLFSVVCHQLWSLL